MYPIWDDIRLVRKWKIQANGYTCLDPGETIPHLYQKMIFEYAMDKFDEHTRNTEVIYFHTLNFRSHTNLEK